jgi:transforming growth factor-beta-induced protein
MYKTYTKRNWALAAILIITGLFVSANALAVKPENRVTIVDVALAVNGGALAPTVPAGEFSTLYAALVGTGLDAVLDGNGQFTVFAPTDQAFMDAFGLDAAGMTAFTSGEVGKEFVTGILLYHVARGERLSGDVLGSEQIRMLNRSFTYPDASDFTIVDNKGEKAGLILDPNLVDVPADNGVIHVIDSVLMPE